MAPARPARGDADLAGSRLLSTDPPPAPRPAPRWGIGDAIAGLAIANVAAVFVGAAILAATGNVEEAADGNLTLAMTAVLQIPLWSGYLGVPIYAARFKGNGLVADFKLRMELLDVPKGIGAGLITQLLAIPALYVLLFAITDALGWDLDHDLSGAAKELVSKAGDPVGVVLLVLITVVLAPPIEELFFRGLLMRSIENRFGRGWALWATAIVFGAVHLQPLQFPALVLIGLVLGWLALRTDRLGPSIWAHVAFNATATITLLAAEHVAKAEFVSSVPR